MDLGLAGKAFVPTVAKAVETFGRLDGALISVGGPPRGTAAEVTDEQWRDAFGAAKDMADEFGPRGIRIFSLLPHRILTDRNIELFAATGDAAKARAEAEAAIPLGRLGDPAEFGRVATFLLSPAASYLTGIAVPVDGGALRVW